MNKNYRKKKSADLDLLEVPGDPDGATILLFHGFGADARDLVPLSELTTGHPRPTWIFPNGPLEVPISYGWTGRAWFPVDIEKLINATRVRSFEEIVKAFPLDLKAARLTVETLIEELNIPRAKLILGGFSQGGVLATEVALNGFQRCAALLILSGTLIHEKQWERLAHLHAGLSFFQSHGEYDTVLPLHQAKALETLLISAGCKGKLHTFPGGHEIPPMILQQLKKYLDNVLDLK